MPETRISDEALGRALSGVEIVYPPVPSLVPAVLSRLQTERPARAWPAFPRTLLWSRRRLLAAIAIGILGLLALAFGARFVLGAAEIRVQPGTTPSGSPLAPGGLGEPVSVEAVSSATGFELSLPPGAPPDEAYVVEFDQGQAALLAWDANRRYPSLPGTPWGLVLMEIESDDEVVVKDVNAFEDLLDVEVGGRPAVWIGVPHRLTVITSLGEESFAVRGNVLIWTEDGITFRLETSLPRRAAIDLAESIR
jgi:hypothetical protein